MKESQLRTSSSGAPLRRPRQTRWSAARTAVNADKAAATCEHRISALDVPGSQQ